MSKRRATEEEIAEEELVKSRAVAEGASAVDGRQAENEKDNEMGEFEDPYGDDFESEDEIIELNDEEDEDEDEEVDAEALEEDLDSAMAVEKKQKKEQPRLYLPQLNQLGKDETLEPDPTVYDMLHRINLNWPCLSFDILPDNLGDERRGYPKTTYFVASTQAARKKENEITVIKLSDLSKTLERDEDDDEEEDDDDDVDADPILESRSLPTSDTTNRIRVSPHAAATGEYLTASLSESGDVYIWDLSPHMTAFDTPGATVTKAQNRPVHTIRAHGGVEGYAVDWSPHVVSGQLLTGDVTGRIHLSTRGTSSWTTDKTPFVGHESGASVEELQWSRSEKSVFASGGSDGFIRVWDIRSKKHKPALSIKASASDVNVMSWSSTVSYLLASGHDDGSWGIWDLRSFKAGEQPEPAAAFNFNKAPITAIEFHPTEESIVAVSSADNTVMLWDLSVEADDEEIAAQKREDSAGELDDIPAQLLFVHWQRDVKEVHWHRQIPGMLMSTGGDGMSVWKSISV